MPELPEVETIKSQLNKTIKGKRIINVKVSLPKIIKAPLEKFKRAVLGSKIINIRRRAKLIIIDLSSGYSLLIHLKMTGQLIYCPSYETRSRSAHTHLIILFQNNAALFYNDLRQFGYIKLVKTKRVRELIDKEYGPEPFDKNFTLSAFKGLIEGKLRQNGKIKQFLIDQKNIAGIGNIYADEILFFSGVMPTRKISTLSINEIKKIYEGIRKILATAIKFRGSSVNNYLDSQGRVGEYHLRLKVYSRGNQPCKKCGVKIKKIKLGGRGTHFCPNCQK